MSKIYRIEGVCANEVNHETKEKCGAFLIGSAEKPHFTAEDIHKKWTMMVTSAPLHTPRCPKCGYSTGSDYNARLDFLIDDGDKKISSDEWFATEKKNTNSQNPKDK